MADAAQKGLGDAAAGAGLGASFGGPYGAGIGGVLGGLFGLFSGSDSTPQAPLFSDINLAHDNPQLYQQLQAQQAMVNQAQAAYTSRTRGETAQEQAQYQQMMGQQNQAAGARGMLGTAQGQQAQEAAALNFNNQLNANRMQQQNQLFGNWQSGQQNLTNATQAGLQQTYNAEMVPYQQSIGQAGNQNQMYSGLMSGGLSMLGQGLNSYNNNQTLQQIAAQNGMLPPGFTYGQNGQGVNFQGGQGGGYNAPIPPGVGGGLNQMSPASYQQMMEQNSFNNAFAGNPQTNAYGMMQQGQYQ